MFILIRILLCVGAFCGVMLGTHGMAVGGAPKQQDMAAIWKQQYAGHHVLAEFDGVVGAALPLHIFCLKCNIVGEPDLKPMVPGTEMMVFFHVWRQRHGQWSKVITLSMKCPQGEWHYDALITGEKLILQARGIESVDEGIAAWEPVGACYLEGVTLVFK